MAFTLQFDAKFDGKTLEYSFPVSENDAVTFGRSQDCDVGYSDIELSRKHLSFFVRDGQFFVRDENSSNGTFLNDQRLNNESPIAVGAVIRAGTVIIHITGLESPSAQITPMQVPPVGRPLGREDQTPPATANPLGSGPQVQSAAVDNSKPQADGVSRRWRVENFQFQPKPFVEYFGDLYSDPKKAYQKIELESPVEKSFILIAAIAFVSAIITVASSRLSPFTLPANVQALPFHVFISGPIVAVVMSFIGAGILHLVRGWLGVTHEFRHFLSFLALATIAFYPLQLLSILLPRYAILFQVLSTALWVIGFFQVFRPNRDRFFLLVIGLGFCMVLSLFGIGAIAYLFGGYRPN